jgi:2C-methyl-D-erythritol 2,4-cyclodiphosphate synthase
MTVTAPADNSDTDVVVHTVSGASVTATAHYKTTDTSHSATASGGRAEIEFRISRATPGYPVEVDVTVSAHGSSGSCSTSFTPHK